MRKLPTFRVTIIILLFSFPFQTFAWGTLGHRIVGEIADSYLSPAARVKVRAILGNESIAMSSNWADFIKSDTSYRYLSPWHYLDFDSAIGYYDVKAFLLKDTAVDAYTRLNFLIKELRNKDLAQPKKLFYLRMLIHIVGDIHQPLHVGYKSDQGGNTIRVSWFNDPANLHSVWDSYLIDFQKLSYTEYTKAINFSTPEFRQKLQSQSLADWFFDSYLVCEKIHKEISHSQPRLGFEYNFQNIDILNRQLLKGGIRLAGLLNSLFEK
jgi:hypothetical protein